MDGISVFTQRAAFYNTGVQTRSIVAFLVILVSPAALDRAAAQSQDAITETACNKLKTAEASLSRTFESILRSKAADANFGKAFREAQTAWATYRDAHVRAIYPDPDPRAYGSAYSMCRCSVLEQMTTNACGNFAACGSTVYQRAMSPADVSPVPRA